MGPGFHPADKGASYQSASGSVFRPLGAEDASRNGLCRRCAPRSCTGSRTRRCDSRLGRYDFGNSTLAGFDVVREIRWLGKNRICQFHLKDNPHYLGEGSIAFGPILEAIHDIGFSGYANLETDVPAAELEAGMKRNLAYIRRLLAQT